MSIGEIEAAFAASAACCLAMAVWIRRWTLFPSSDKLRLREQSFTAGLLLQIAWLFLVSPLSTRTLGNALHAVSGVWGIDIWAGHCCYIASFALFSVHVASRLTCNYAELGTEFKKRFGHPMTLIGPILLAVLVMSPNASRRNVFAANPDLWIAVYWTALCALLIFVLAIAVYLLRIAGKMQHNKRIASIYLAACGVAIVVGGLRILTAWAGAASLYQHWFLAADCAVAIAFAYGAGHSWRQRVRRLSARSACFEGDEG